MLMIVASRQSDSLKRDLYTGLKNLLSKKVKIKFCFMKSRVIVSAIIEKNGEMTHYIMLVFHIEPESKNIIAGDDLESLQWFKKSELKKLSLPRPSEIFYRENGLL